MFSQEMTTKDDIKAHRRLLTLAIGVFMLAGGAMVGWIKLPTSLANGLVVGG